MRETDLGGGELLERNKYVEIWENFNKFQFLNKLVFTKSSILMNSLDCPEF